MQADDEAADLTIEYVIEHTASQVGHEQFREHVHELGAEVVTEREPGEGHSEYSEYVAVGPTIYGRGLDKETALVNMASHLDDVHPDDTIEVLIYEVPVDADWSIGMYSFECEADIRDRTHHEFQGEDLATLRNRAHQLERDIEDAFIHAEEVNDE